VTLAVYTSQGRATAVIAPAVLGGLLGGRLGSSLQPKLRATTVRRLLSVVLVVTGIVLVVQA